MNYGEVLSKSWKIIWKYKILWLFGILAGCAEGSSGGGGGARGGGNYNGNYGNGNNFNFDTNQAFPWLEKFVNRATDFIQNIPWWVWVLLFLAILALTVLSIFLGIMGRTGLIRGAGLGDSDPQRITLGQLWSSSLHYFWRVFLLGLLYLGVILLIMMVTIVPIVLMTVLTMGIIWILLIPLLCLLIPLSWALDIFVKQSYIALVNDDLGVFDAIKRAWQVFRDHIGHLLVMGLILFFGALVIELIISLPVLFAIAPVVAGFINNTAASMRNGVIAALVIVGLYMPVGILLSGILRGYIYSAWTLTFRRLTTPPAALNIEPLPIVVPPAAEPPLS